MMDLSSLPDETPCALLIGSGDMTVGELREALGVAAEALLRMDPKKMTDEEVVRATKEMWARRATENYSGPPFESG